MSDTSRSVQIFQRVQVSARSGHPGRIGRYAKRYYGENQTGSRFAFFLHFFRSFFRLLLLALLQRGGPLAGRCGGGGRGRDVGVGGTKKLTFWQLESIRSTPVWSASTESAASPRS